MDLIFALSASSSDANTNFQRMKQIFKAMIDTYGRDQVNYSLITFGETPSVKIRFSDSFSTDEELKNLVDAVPRSSGSPALAETMNVAEKLFKGGTSRDTATKILVIMMDNKSGSAAKDVKEKGKSLDESGVRVIAVGVGDQFDATELNRTTPYKKDIISTSKTNDPEQIAKKILTKGLEKRKFVFT